MSSGDADTFVAALLSQDPANHSSFATLAKSYDSRIEFLRGMDNCAEGLSYNTTWSNYRQRGWKSGQALGLFDVWSKPLPGASQADINAWLSDAASKVSVVHTSPDQADP